MNPTEEFEIYQFLCKEAEAYVSLSQLLKDAHLTMEAASSAVADFRKQFQDGLQHWQISNQNPAAISLDLLQALQEHPGDSQLSFLYAAWITDRGLLFDWHPENRSEEQDIRVWLKQSKTVSEFQAFLQEQAIQKAQLPIFKQAAKKFQRNAEKGTDERDAIFYLSIQNPFFYAGRKSTAYVENIGELLRLLNGNPQLQAAKPYIIFAILSRKHGMMMNREHFIPNLQAAFQYQIYHIDFDNGKNFDNYQCYIELYETLRQFYRDDSNVNLPFCDYCFANLCPLSRWYYENCEPNEQIPMNIQQKAEMITAMIFPDLYDDSEDVEMEAIPEEWEEQLAEHPEWMTEFLQACAVETDRMAVVSHLWTEPPEQQLQQAAEQVFYFYAKDFLRKQIWEAAEWLLPDFETISSS